MNVSKLPFKLAILLAMDFFITTTRIHFFLVLVGIQLFERDISKNVQIFVAKQKLRHAFLQF